MSRQCTICTHANRQAIERALRQDKPYRTIAARYTVSKSALSRHHETCLGVLAGHETGQIAGQSIDNGTHDEPIEATQNTVPIVPIVPRLSPGGIADYISDGDQTAHLRWLNTAPDALGESQRQDAYLRAFRQAWQSMSPHTREQALRWLQEQVMVPEWAE